MIKTFLQNQHQNSGGGSISIVKIPASNRCHIFLGVFNNKISCALTNFKPAWKILNWNPITGQLIDSSVALLIKFVCERQKISPPWPGVRSQYWSQIEMRGPRLWKTGPLHGIARNGEIGEVWMGRWVKPVWHWQGRLQLCGWIGTSDCGGTVTSGYI